MDLDKYRELLIKVLERAGNYISCSHCQKRIIDKTNKVTGCQREVTAMDNLQCLIKKLFYFELPKEVENKVEEAAPKAEAIAQEVTEHSEEKEIVGY